MEAGEKQDAGVGGQGQQQKDQLYYLGCGAEVGALMLSLLERSKQKEKATQLLLSMRPKDRTLIAGAYSELINQYGSHTGTKNVSRFW